MKNINYRLLLLLTLSSCSIFNRRAKVPPVLKQEEEKICAYPSDYRFITDYGKTFTLEQGQELDSLLLDFYNKQHILIQIYTAHSPFLFKDFDEFVYSVIKGNEFDKHKIDKWVVISLSKGEKQIQIHKAKSIDPVLTAEVAQQIINRDFIPKYKEDNYFEGTKSGLKGLILVLENNIEAEKE